MKRIFVLLICTLFVTTLLAQGLTAKLATAFQQFEGDAQLKSAMASLYVVEAKTGKVVFDKNSTIGLAPASAQKIITAATAYELLGKDFRYKTEFGTTGKEGATVLYIKPSGDPTFGSWRWDGTKEAIILNKVVQAFVAKGTNRFEKLVVEAKGWNSENIPDGWIWQDIGNYYGAGATALNWRENQFDVVLSSGNAIGDAVQVVQTKPKLYNYAFTSVATAAGKGTGDNAYIYFTLNHSTGMVRGTIPVSEKAFLISGAMPVPDQQFAYTLMDAFGQKILFVHQQPTITYDSSTTARQVVYTHTSPDLDSLIYWFNRKSINLYGEALVKAMGYRKNGQGATDEGIRVIKDFWKEKGVAATSLNMVDGSGLSPLNRVTTGAQVAVLQHARKQNWYPGFYQSLPEYNGMKMKSGTIRGVKGFTGYHTASNGTEYIFAFLVNNYNGASGALVQKMYKVLDVLK